MTHVAPSSAEPCVWMTAGLVSYKLCDWDFDCRRCPLDAALRGGAPAPIQESLLPGTIRRGEGFPGDRRYAASHTWVASGLGPGDPLLRVGLDGFAAAVLPRPLGVSWSASPRELGRGDVVCEIELAGGIFPVGAPVGGRLERGNPALREQPGLIVESPYHDGWLVELAPSGADAALEGLLDAEQARERTALDLRRFRRRIALHLLADAVPGGPCMADGGEVLTSLPEILGGSRYLETLREILR
jgi:glycine cleavage system H protein